MAVTLGEQFDTGFVGQLERLVVTFSLWWTLPIVLWIVRILDTKETRSHRLYIPVGGQPVGGGARFQFLATISSFCIVWQVPGTERRNRSSGRFIGTTHLHLEGISRRKLCQCQSGRFPLDRQGEVLCRSGDPDLYRSGFPLHGILAMSTACMAYIWRAPNSKARWFQRCGPSAAPACKTTELNLADLQDTDLTWAVLDGADLNEARLDRSNLSNSTL